MGKLHRDQTAFVAIFTVLIIMTILALVTVGFSSVTRSAQRRTLDNQLNTQAFYSAESAVNDAKAYLEANPGSNITTCPAAPPAYFTYSLDAGRNFGYTCVLINSSPPDLGFSSVPVEAPGNTPTVLPFESSNNSPIISFNVSWRGSDGSATPVIPSPAAGTYPLDTTGNWGSKLGIVRVDLAPVTVDRATMINNSYTFFLYPSQNGALNISPVSNTSSQQGGIMLVRCTSLPCTTTVQLGGTTYSKYVLRLQSLYSSVHVDITNLRTVAPGTPSFVNAQAVVDATGKANDVFRRIQVRLPLTNRGLTPAFAIQSADSICKRMLASPTGSVVDSSAIDATGNTNGPCTLDN